MHCPLVFLPGSRAAVAENDIWPLGTTAIEPSGACTETLYRTSEDLNTEGPCGHVMQIQDRGQETAGLSIQSDGLSRILFVYFPWPWLMINFA